jgi:hypothetical protein
MTEVAVVQCYLKLHVDTAVGVIMPCMQDIIGSKYAISFTTNGLIGRSTELVNRAVGDE